jgi:hypothetical protein
MMLPKIKYLMLLKNLHFPTISWFFVRYRGLCFLFQNFQTRRLYKVLGCNSQQWHGVQCIQDSVCDWQNLKPLKRPDITDIYIYIYGKNYLFIYLFEINKFYMGFIPTIYNSKYCSVNRLNNSYSFSQHRSYLRFSWICCLLCEFFVSTHTPL